MEITRTRIYRGGQSLNLDRHISLNDGGKMLIEIKRDSYDEQSYARVSLWSSDGWKVLLWELLPELSVYNFSSVSTGPWQDAIEMDAIELADQAFDVLGIGVKR